MSDMDTLLDLAHELGLKPRKHFRWGRHSDGSWWVEMVLPDKKVTSSGDSLEFAAWHLMYSTFPNGEDRP